jgi:hypothetical protein
VWASNQYNKASTLLHYKAKDEKQHGPVQTKQHFGKQTKPQFDYAVDGPPHKPRVS